MSKVFINASPAERIALDSLDRTVFGDQAINNAILQDAIRAGQVSKARKSSAANITLKSERNCVAGTSEEAGNCLSEFEWREKAIADGKARDAAYRDAALKKRADMAAESARLAAERTSSYAQCQAKPGVRCTIPR